MRVKCTFNDACYESKVDLYYLSVYKLVDSKWFQLPVAVVALGLLEISI